MLVETTVLEKKVTADTQVAARQICPESHRGRDHISGIDKHVIASGPVVMKARHNASANDAMSLSMTSDEALDQVCCRDTIGVEEEQILTTTEAGSNIPRLGQGQRLGCVDEPYTFDMRDALELILADHDNFRNLILCRLVTESSDHTINHGRV